MAKKEFDALEIIESLTDEIEIDVRKTGLAVLRTVVQATPVGNPTLWQSRSAPKGYVGGHARRNWAVSTARPIDGVRGKAGKGGGAGKASNQAISQGTKRIESYTVQATRIIIQNNVPDIVPLNNGHSTQAPPNFVQKAVMAGRNVDRNSRKELP